MPEQMQAMSSKVRKLFDTAIKQSLMPDGKRLSRGSYAKLDELLTMGDENSKVYDFKEAVETGVNGIKLNPVDICFLSYQHSVVQQTRNKCMPAQNILCR